MKRKLSHQQIQHFINYGYIKLEKAFSLKLAEESRAVLWKDTGCTPDDPTTWTQAVIRLAKISEHSQYVSRTKRTQVTQDGT